MDILIPRNHFTFHTRHNVAEKALATLDGRPMVHAFPQVVLHLHPEPPTSPPSNWPAPSAATRVVSSLPPSFTDSKLFDTFRGFGAIASCRMQPDMGPDVGTVTFWREEDATRAEEVMHMSDVDDYTISVKIFLPMRDTRKQKGLEFNPQAPSFVPSGLSPSSRPPGGMGQMGHTGYAPSMRHGTSSPLHQFSLSPMPSPHLQLGNNSPIMVPGQPLPVMVSVRYIMATKAHETA
jgi:polyadenylate-binding protein